MKDQSYRNKLPGPLKTSHHNIRNSASMEYHHVPSSILTHSVQFSSFSCIQLPVTPWTAARQASLSITDSQSLLRLMSIELVMASNHLILCHPLLLSLSIFPSLRVFSSESVLHIRWPKYWSFSFSISISPYNEYPELISDWFDLLAVQGSSPAPQFRSISSSALSLVRPISDF